MPTSTVFKETPIALKEDIRVYEFSDTKIQLIDVRELVVRESGSHRLKTADGHLHIIPAGWRHIDIVDLEKKDWTT